MDDHRPPRDEKLAMESPAASVRGVKDADVDEAARLVLGREVTQAEGLRLRRKIDWNILPMMCVLYWIQFMDKTTLGSSAILGIRTDAHLSANEYNWLGTVFYISYLIFEYPQNLGLQRFPVAKWMSVNIFIWGVALMAHAACKNFGGLFAVRFILGMCEGSITAGFMLVTSMFYTRREQSQRVGYWFLMNGTAQIISGLLSFGVLHIKSDRLHPWQWFMLMTGIITLFVAAAFWIWFPDSPATARFLSTEEKKIAIERIKVNQTGIENKHFKREQFVETMKDPKTWLFALFSCLSVIPNSLTNQYSIIINSFGFSVLQTTLLGCVTGVVEIVAIWSGMWLVARYENARAYVGMVYFVPAILGAVLVNALPWSNKIGLLFAVWITLIETFGFTIAMAWVTSVTAGHTKRITTNAIFLCSYCIGNIVGPQMWQAQYTPRNRVPWGIITACYCICPFLLWWIRLVLANENRKRDAEAAVASSAEKEAYLDDGTKVDKAFLDLTDRQNRDFRYVL